MLKALQEFDVLSEDIKKELKNNIESNFAKITTDNIVRTLYVLAEGSNYNRVQISQAEISMQLNLSQNRVSELLKLAKKSGLIAIDMICRCGNIRNEYTLLDNPIVNSIKKIVFKSSVADSKESINLAIERTISFYKFQGVAEHILEEVKRRIPVNEFKKASGVFEYFRKTLHTVKRLLEEPAATTNNKKSKGSFCDYEQRPHDPSLEDQLLGWDNPEEPVAESEDNLVDYNALFDKIINQGN